MAEELEQKAEQLPADLPGEVFDPRLGFVSQSPSSGRIRGVPRQPFSDPRQRPFIQPDPAGQQQQFRQFPRGPALVPRITDVGALLRQALLDGDKLVDAEENITAREIQNITRDFIQHVPINSLTEIQSNELSQYLIDHVKNQQLRGLLLETINLGRAKPLKSLEGARAATRGLVFRQAGEDIVLSAKAAEGEFGPEVVQANDFLTRQIKAIPDIEDLRKRDDEYQKLLNDFEEVIEEEFKILRPRMSAGDKVKADNFFSRSTVSRTDIRKKKVRGRAQNLSKLASLLVRVRQLKPEGPPTRFRGPGRKSRAAKLAGISSAKINLKEFSEQLKRDLKSTRLKSSKKSSKKSKGVHRPSVTHEIGDISIFSDNIKRVKEIAIPASIGADDLIKLALALSKEDGVLLTIDGEDIASIVRGEGLEELLKKLAELVLVSSKKKDVLRLLYKPAFALGGHFVGGSFTHPLFNRFNPHKVLAQHLGRRSSPRSQV